MCEEHSSVGPDVSDRNAGIPFAPKYEAILNELGRRFEAEEITLEEFREEFNNVLGALQVEFAALKERGELEELLPSGPDPFGMGWRWMLASDDEE